MSAFRCLIDCCSGFKTKNQLQDRAAGNRKKKRKTKEAANIIRRRVAPELSAVAAATAAAAAAAAAVLRKAKGNPLPSVEQATLAYLTYV
jgi:hypothetical protein